MECPVCGKKANKKIYIHRHSPDFSGIKDVNGNPLEYFCSQKCKSIYKKELNKIDKKAMIYLAQLDMSMNYCEYFNRINGNEGIYKRDGFEYICNGLWDYKSWELKESKIFKEEFIKHFGHFDYFKLHNRYSKEVII